MGRLLDLVASRAGHAECNVVGNRCAEEKRFLRNETDSAAEHCERQIPDINPIDEHRSWRRVVQSRQQVQERRFSGTSGADDRRRRTGRQPCGNSLQHDGVTVRESEIAEFEVSANLIAGGEPRIGTSIGNRWFRGQAPRASVSTKPRRVAAGW